ncbi:hypothetical protein pb186bvf_017923 [Paramecium bursaria]
MSYFQNSRPTYYLYKNFTLITTLTYLQSYYFSWHSKMQLLSNKYIALGFVGLGLAGYLSYKAPKQIEANRNYSFIDIQSSLNYDNIPPGIKNNSNWCFVNSVLQALASQPSFIDYLFRLINYFTSKLTKDMQICIELANILKLELISYTKQPIQPDPLIYLLQEDQNYLFFQEQQDCNELFNLLMKHVENAEKHIRQSYQVMFSREKMNLRNPFQFFTRIQIYCQQCKQKYSIKIESNYVLYLQIGGSIQDSLIKFESTQYIDDFACIYCSVNKLQSQAQNKNFQKYINHDDEAIQILDRIIRDQKLRLNSKNFIVKRRVERRSILIAFPDTLCAYINRLEYINGYPVKSQIPFHLASQIPLELENKNLNLSAVICHQGYAEFGHYFCFRRLFSCNINNLLEAEQEYIKGSWFFISDDNVERCDEPAQCQAAIVFYDSYIQLTDKS